LVNCYAGFHFTVKCQEHQQSIAIIGAIIWKFVSLDTPFPRPLRVHHLHLPRIVFFGIATIVTIIIIAKTNYFEVIEFSRIKNKLKMTITDQRLLGLRSVNGLRGINGVAVRTAYNQLFRPNLFSSEVLGETNWLHPSTLGTQGVEGFTLDNRHIHSSLHHAICDDTNSVVFREYLQLLVS
jgi:hypothetical protein